VNLCTEIIDQLVGKKVIVTGGTGMIVCEQIELALFKKVT
jgi:hypothetical protein